MTFTGHEKSLWNLWKSPCGIMHFKFDDIVSKKKKRPINKNSPPMLPFMVIISHCKNKETFTP